VTKFLLFPMKVLSSSNCFSKGLFFLSGSVFSITFFTLYLFLVSRIYHISTLLIDRKGTLPFNEFSKGWLILVKYYPLLSILGSLSGSTPPLVCNVSRFSPAKSVPQSVGTPSTVAP
jgi:hypothetical protein